MGHDEARLGEETTTVEDLRRWWNRRWKKLRPKHFNGEMWCKEDERERDRDRGERERSSRALWGSPLKAPRGSEEGDGRSGICDNAAWVATWSVGRAWGPWCGGNSRRGWVERHLMHVDTSSEAMGGEERRRKRSMGRKWEEGEQEDGDRQVGPTYW